MSALSDVDFYDGSVGGVVLLSFPQPPQSLARPRWRESRAPPTPRVTLWPPTIPDDATPGWAEGVPSASAAARTSQAVRERRLEIEVQRFQARLERRQREQRERFFETVGGQNDLQQYQDRWNPIDIREDTTRYDGTWG